MKNKIAFVKTGFMFEYLSYLEELCDKHGISHEVFDNYEDIENPSDYDYILLDSIGSKYHSGCCFIFHGHTPLHKLKFSNSFHKLFYFLVRNKKIQKQKNIFETAKLLFTMSCLVKNDLMDNYGISGEKIIVLHPGFVKRKDNDLLKVPKFSGDRDFNISMSAQGFITKGGFVVLKAIRIFRHLYPNVKIKVHIIYPRYKYNLGVRLYVKLFGLDKTVEFCPHQSDMDAFYEKSDCFVCPSLFEPFGRVVTEAMYAKRPVILSSHVGATDVIKDGDNGFIYNADENPAYNLAIKIYEIYSKYNSLDEVIKRAYKTSKSLDWRNFANDIIKNLYFLP